MEKHLLSRWGELPAKVITRADVRAAIGTIDSPSVANQTLAAASAIFSFGLEMEVVAINPARGIKRNEMQSRERVINDSEMPRLWAALDGVDSVTAAALKTVLLTGQRPGEVRHMRTEHVVDGWWEMPGKPEGSRWPGTKNSRTHRFWLPKPVRAILDELGATGFAFPSSSGRGKPIDDLDHVMREVSERLKLNVTIRPHDLRRTFGSAVTRLSR